MAEGRRRGAVRGSGEAGGTALPSRRLLFHSLLLCPLLVSAACGGGGARVVVAGTTSLQDSGLLDTLMVTFRRSHPDLDLKVIAVGSGEALELGRRGDVDVLLVHSPEAEDRFMAAGHGHDRVPLMYNDFVLVGPPEDPARVAGARNAVDAFARIARSGAPFLSRGDDSGTHVRERELWAEAGIRPGGDWHRESGQGQGETLQIAGERGAYALTDRSTFVAMRDILRLRILFEGDPDLLNLYSVIEVARSANPEGGAAFAGWLTSEAGRLTIASFGAEREEGPLFVPLIVGERLPFPDSADTLSRDSAAELPR